MALLIKNVVVVDPASPFHRQKVHLLVEGGKVLQVSSNIADGAQSYDAGGACISPGWTDPFCFFGEPGFEYRETLQTGSAAAAAGGYTNVLLLPGTLPVTDNRNAVERLNAYAGPVQLHATGAITKAAQGKELAEMYDMAAGGAVAFSDGYEAVQESGVLLKALEYLKAIDKVLIQRPDDRSIAPHGLMNEGALSVKLGLAGRPAIAEELAVAKAIELAKYTAGRLHLTGISTAAAVQRISAAKSEGIAVTCSVSPHHLYFSEEALEDYNSNFKLDPPLRNRDDVAALKAALLDGTIDCVATHHLPQHVDQKRVEFEYAKPGMISLQTAFAAVATAVPQADAEKLVQLFTAARSLFGLPAVTINEGSKAAFTLFRMHTDWTFEKTQNQSLANNSAYFGHRFTARPIGTITQSGLHLSPA